MRIAVFGATGPQGSAQVRALVRADHRPVAISRSPQPWRIDAVEIETVAADFADHASLDAAVEGADAVFLNLPSTSLQEAAPLVAAAARIGRAAARSPATNLLVFNTSLPVPAEKLGFAAQDARHDIRRLLRESGVPTISIEPVVFLDNLLERWAWPPIVERNMIVYAHEETLDVSWICHDDLAKLMVAALERPHLAGRNFAVGGAETVRLPQLAEKLGRAWNRPLGYESQSIDAFCERMRRAFDGRSSLDADRLIGELHRIYTWYNTSPTHPFRVDMAPVLAELPVVLTPIETWARAHMLPEAPKAVASAE